MALRISSPFGLLSRGASAPARLEAETSYQTHIYVSYKIENKEEMSEKPIKFIMPIVDDAIISVT